MRIIPGISAPLGHMNGVFMLVVLQKLPAGQVVQTVDALKSKPTALQCTSECMYIEKLECKRNAKTRAAEENEKTGGEARSTIVAFTPRAPAVSDPSSKCSVEVEGG
jgi:hypothetical protein